MTFCNLLYHRKCKRRGVGSQKKPNFVNIVCELPLVRMFFRLVPMHHWRVFIEYGLLGLDSRCSLTNLLVVFNWNHYFGLGPIPKPKMADTITTGQTKSKLVFSSQCFFQKMNVYIQLYYYDTSGWLVFVCFLEENGWFESGPWFQFTILKVVFGFTLPLGTLIS